MAWNPWQYGLFVDQRQRPAIELLARVPTESPVAVVDLGCGTGNVTRLLAQRWPEASITGVDASETMLTEARKQGGRILWEQARLEDRRPPAAGGSRLFERGASLDG